MKRYEDYVVIQAWQRDLQLPDKLEKLYAMIWNISKDGRSRMRATSSYIAEWCHCSQRHAKRMIYALEDMGLVAHEVVYDRRKGCNVTEFWAIIPDDAERPEKGTKDKISWTGKKASNEGDQSDTHVPNQSDTHVPNQSDTHVPNHTGSNNSINTTRDKYRGKNTRIKRDDAQKSMVVFNPPTIQEVAEYSRAQGFADPEGFAEYYVAYQTEAGWMTGKGSKRHPIDNWKLNVIAWGRYRKNEIFNEGQAAPERRTAAEEGEPYAQFLLGTACLQGLGGEKKDLKKAKEWFLKAAKQGETQAQVLLQYHPEFVKSKEP